MTPSLLNRLLSYSKKTIAKIESDQMLLCFVAVLGLSGSIFLIQNSKCSQQHFDESQYQYQYTQVFPEFERVQKMKVSGSLVNHSKLHFTINKKQEGRKYVVDFGNGDKKIINKHDFSYSYDNPGNYKVKVMVLNNSDYRVLESRKLQICNKF